MPPSLRTPTDAPIADLPPALLRELRSDHAGELGAVWIYRGILAVTRDEGLRAFAQRHMAAEQAHLAFFLGALPARCRSRLAPLWRLSGWLLGALPALFGPRAAFRTVAAVETFVDGHYALQIRMLEAHPDHAWLRERLIEFRADERAHRDDAAGRLPHPDAGGLWGALVRAGSALGASCARRL